MSSSLSPAGRLFTIAAFAEGLTWAGLLVGMLLKYGTQTTGIPPSDLGVWLFGRLHGAAFLFYEWHIVVALLGDDQRTGSRYVSKA